MIPVLVFHLWQSTLFAGIAWLLTLALRKNQAHVRYRIWFIASAKFLIPFSLLVGLGALVPRHIAAPEPQTAWAATAEQVAQPLNALPEDVARAVATAGPVKQNHFAVFAWAFWVCGFAAITICWSARWKGVYALRKSAIPVNISGCIELAVPVRSVKGLVEPGIFGIFRPVLLLPDGIEERLDREQLDAILAHELCHVRRRDNLTATIHMAVQAIFWFHPLVWWLGSHLVDERERACDEEVLRLGCRPHIYAAGILNVCKLYVESSLACLSGVTGSDLKKRIHRIVSGRIARDLSFAAKVGLMVAGAACLALPVLIGLGNAPPMRGQTEAFIPLSPPSGVKFRSASIERCQGYMQGAIESPAPGRLVANCVTSVSLIQLAWLNAAVPSDGPPVQLLWDPVWLGSGNYRYRVDAHADRSASIASMEGPMLQALLADHYHLKIHRETRDVAAFALTVAKGGPRLRPSDAASCDGKWPGNAPPQWPGRGVRSQCVSFTGPLGQGETLEGQALSLQDFASLLSGPLRTWVIDQTGISGKFDFHLTFASNQTSGLLSQLYPPLPEVVEKQLGLKLERTAQRRQFLVIDHAEKPIPD